MDTAQIVLAGLTAAGSVGVWAHRITSRVDTIEKVLVEREKLQDERHEELKSELSEIKQLIRVRK